MRPAMELICQEECKRQARAQYAEELWQRAGGHRTCGNQDDQRDCEESVISGNFKEVMTSDSEGVFVMISEWSDQHGTEQRCRWIEETIGDPMHCAGNEIGQQVPGDDCEDRDEPAFFGENRRRNMNEHHRPGDDECDDADAVH